MLEKSFQNGDMQGLDMTMNEASAGIKSKASFGETIKITDEMDRLLCEMKEIMRTIQRILGEETEEQPSRLSIEDNAPYFPSEHIMQSS